MPQKTHKTGEALEELVLYLLHCGLDGKLLQQICLQHGLKLSIHQFPREELFAYHMHEKRKPPDVILIRGHFISLVEDLDKQRHIPYLVISSKLKYGHGQPVFIHAEKGYDGKDTLPLYHAIARSLKEMVDAKHAQARAAESAESTAPASAATKNSS
jgi:hypothetical protein